jgi:hypothetical protein
MRFRAFGSLVDKRLIADRETELLILFKIHQIRDAFPQKFATGSLVLVDKSEQITRELFNPLKIPCREEFPVPAVGGSPLRVEAVWKRCPQRPRQKQK